MNNLYWCGLVASLCGTSVWATDFISESSATLWFLHTNRVECTMTQEIHNWGAVDFTIRAAKEPELEVFIKPNLRFSKDIPVYARTTAPNWRHGISDKSLGSFKGYEFFDGYIKGKQAWSFVQGLQNGLAVSFTYRDDLHYGDDYVRAIINPYGFDTVYKDFTFCMRELLPYNFDDIKYAVIHFVGKTKSLTDYSYERLRRIADYLSSDPNFVEVIISVHTDAYGENEANMKITREQADVVKRFFTEKGVPDGKIIVRAYGEEHQAVSNEYVNQLPINRRVVIEVNNEARVHDKQ